MTKRRIIPIATANIRSAWFEKLGGIENVSVQNKEWLILLKEDTRHSLMIEGYFVSRAEIADIIEKPKYTKTGYKVLGYFDSAFASYELAFQQYKTKEFKLTKSIIRQMHSIMFRGDPHFAYTPGEWRKGDIKIVGAKIDASPPAEIESRIEALIKIVNKPTKDLTRKLAVTHDMFEQIHPFPDGNGRVGRILLNFILVGNGYPNIAIKGFGKDKQEYIDTLEQADPIVQNLLENPREDPFAKPLILLEDLINRSRATAMDVIICNRFNDKKPLMTLKEVATEIKSPLDTVRVACSQKRHICSKVDGKVKTHPDLFSLPTKK